jgi:formate dehydrogenase subunit delta
VKPERLAEMANDIASFFAAEPEREVAVDGVCNHIKRFWEPRMRRQIIAHLRESDGTGMSELARAGVEKLATLEQASARQA